MFTAAEGKANKQKKGEHLNRIDDLIKRVRQLRPIDDAMFKKLAESKAVCQEIPDVVIVYISEYDVFRSERTIYHINSIIMETNTVVDDGLRRIFVNTQYADTDNTDVGELMKCFLQKEINSNKFPELSERLSFFKNVGKGVDSMCDIIKDYAKEYAKEYADERAAEVLVEIIENIARSTGSIDEACEIAKKSRKQYDAAKELLEKSLTV